MASTASQTEGATRRFGRARGGCSLPFAFSKVAFSAKARTPPPRIQTAREARTEARERVGDPGLSVDNSQAGGQALLPQPGVRGAGPAPPARVRPIQDPLLCPRHPWPAPRSRQRREARVRELAASGLAWVLARGLGLASGDKVRQMGGLYIYIYF